MARQGEIRPERQGGRDIDPRSTYDSTTPDVKVAARNIDTYHRPPDAYRVQQDADLVAMTQFLQMTTGAMESGAKAYGAYQDKESEEGKILKAAGKPLPDDASSAKASGYEMMSGEAEVVDFKTKLADIVTQFPDDDPETYQKRTQELLKSSINGRSEAWVKGFVPNARKALSDSALVFHKTKQEEIATKTLSANTKIFSDKVLEALKTEKDDDKVALIYREAVTGMQDTTKPYGVTPKAAALSAVGIIANAAVNADNKLSPAEANRLAAILPKLASLPDNKGIALTQTDIRDKVEAEISAANTAATTRTTAGNTARKEFSKELNNILLIKGYEAVASKDAAGMASVERLIYKYSDPRRNDEGVVIDHTALKEFFELKNKAASGELQYAKVSDTQTLQSIKNRLYADPMSVPDGELLKSSTKLSASDFDQLLGLKANGIKEVGNKEMKDWKEQKEMYGKLVRQLTPMGIDIEKEGPARLVYFYEKVQDRYNDAVKLNGGKPLTDLKVQREILKGAAQDAFNTVRNTIPGYSLTHLGISVGPEDAPKTNKPGAPALSTPTDDPLILQLREAGKKVE
jgi:hypothetical protein